MMKTCTIVANVNAPQGHKDYEEFAIRLAKSIRLNGGEAKDMPICFWYPDDYLVPSDKTLKALESYGCKLNHGPAGMMHIYPVYGKVYAMMQQVKTDYAMHIDTDCYVRGDISGLFKDLDKDVRLCPVGFSTTKWTQPEGDQRMTEYYAHFGLKRNTTNTPGLIDKISTRFYFTSCLVIFRGDIEFGKKYRDVLNGTIAVDRIGEAYNANSQVSIGITATKFNLSWALVDAHYMYLFNHHHHKLDGSNPAIVHYQGIKIPSIGEGEWNV